MVTIKEAATITGISEPTLRYYEKEGLVHPSRSEGGYRLYSDDNIQTLKYIVVMKHAKFPLQEIKEMMHMADLEVSDSCREKTLQILNKRTREVEKTIETYQSILKMFQTLIQSTDGLENREQMFELDRFVNEIYKETERD